MIILLPLESLEQRYTEAWSRWFPQQLTKDRTPFKTINGIPLTSKIEVGSVLDAYGTSYFKCLQLAELIKQIRGGEVTNKDVLLFADLWFPGIEALQYISCLGGARPRITGILHAGTWDPADFTVRSGMRPWAHELESAWFQIYDLIFVATMWHKELILKNHHVDPNKIVVTGLPFYPDEITVPRKNIKKDSTLVVFPHRLDPEKHPEQFDALANGFPDLRFVKTAEHFLCKASYYDELASASIAISFADQETFGYAMLEATALGCYPLVPDRLSYQEMYPSKFRYRTYQELCVKLKDIVNTRTNEEVYALAFMHRAKYTMSITNMTQAIYSRLYA